MGDFTDLDAGPVFNPPAERPSRRAIFDLLQQPHTIRELSHAMNLTKDSIGYHLAILTAPACKRVHVSGWRSGNAGPFVAVYLAGNAPDAPKPPYRPGVRHPPRVKPLTMALRADERDAALLAALTEPMTIPVLADKLGLIASAVMYSLNRLRAADHRRVHIAGYRKCGVRATWQALYAVGNEPDAPKPTAKKTGRPIFDPQPDLAGKARELVKAATEKPNTWYGALGL